MGEGDARNCQPVEANPLGLKGGSRETFLKIEFRVNLKCIAIAPKQKRTREKIGLNSSIHNFIKSVRHQFWKLFWEQSGTNANLNKDVFFTSRLPSTALFGGSDLF